MQINFILERADLSGGVRAVSEFAKELLRRGHDVTAFSAPYPTAGAREKLRAIAGRRDWPGPAGMRPSHLDGSGVKHIVIESSRAIGAADLPNADAVIATWWRTAQWVAALPPAKGAKLHLIQHYETWGGPAEDVDAVWRLPLHRVVVSRWLADIARDKFGDATASLVPYGLDHAQFHAPPRGKQSVPTIGMLYSTTPFKGCDVAIKAIELARKTCGDLKVIALGVGAPDRKLPLPPGAVYVKNPPQHQLKDIYAACDGWLCASHAEGFYMPALEAMACRCPVISTRVGWPMEAIVDGVNGFLADVGDVAQLARHLAAIANLSNEQWRAMSDAAFTTARPYTWQRAGELFEAAIATAIATPHPRASA
jgi:glycosyltransferase involved in cell wall biosynthesis